MNIHFKQRSPKPVLMAAILLAITALSGAAYAGTATNNLSVTATVAANCTIGTTAAAFGTYDPIITNAAVDLTGTGTVTVTCTSGSADYITLSQGANPTGTSTPDIPARQMISGANLLTYSLYSDSGRTTVWGDTGTTGLASTGNGAAQALTVYGSIAAGQNVPAGSYTDTVLATVTF